MRLRFGNLEDIILVKKEEIRMLQVEYNALIIQECDNVEKCELRLAGIDCDKCILSKQCRDESVKIFARVDIIEEKMKSLAWKLKYLYLELFISQNKGVVIKHINLELFP